MKGNRILTTVLAALTLLTAPVAFPQQTLPLNAVTASAANNTIASGTIGNAKWTLDGFGTLTVSGGRNETISVSGWAKYRTQIKSVVIDSANAVITSNAFKDCTNLKSVRIPNSVEEIGTCAFNGCIGLEDIRIPNSVKSIGEEAFYACHLKTVTIPGSVRHIGKKAFGYWRAFWEYKRDLTICGSPGSAAADYARYNDFRFISVIERYML